MLTAATGLTLALTWSILAPASEGTLACSCNSGIELDHSLPLSHPLNRCATGQQSEVSWSSWLKGGNELTQFHFLDLLELLSRYHDEAQDQQTSS
ncbi:hypothetical protein GCM10027098_04120 [Bowmanella dokdonensis]